MAEAAQPETPRPSRLDRRKARTRQALIDAAVHLIAEGRADRASIQEITESADIGFGSFYNHFDSKDELFATASAEVLERWGQMIDRACAGIADPAEVFAVSFRISGRLRLDTPRHRPLPHRRRAGRPGFTHRPGAPRAARHPGRAASRALHRPRRGRRPQRGRRRPARACYGSARTTRNG